MKISSFILLAAAALSFSACTESSTTETTTTETSSTDTLATDPFAENTMLDSAHTGDISTESQPGADPFAGSQPAISQPGQTPSGSTAKGVNPAHGEPGHDCAIPVGAPLGSGGASASINTKTPDKTPAPIQNSPTITADPGLGSVTPVTPSQGSVASGKGLNPAHGEPGHDCAVPVGAPLK